jgi:hypothetical protein
MNTFYIYFWGLICHVGKNKNDTDEKKHASLVHTAVSGGPGTHVPKLIFSDGTEEELGGNVTFASGHSHAKVSSDFGTYVASLKALIGQNTDLKQSVYAADPSDAYHCHYPRGTVTLSAADLYEKQGIYFVDGAPQAERPVARIVVAKVETADVDIEVRFKTNAGAWKTRKITPEDPCMLVANAERVSDTIDDASFYMRLLDQPKSLAVDDGSSHLLKLPFPGCAWVRTYVEDQKTKRLRAASSTECGNSSWP